MTAGNLIQTLFEVFGFSALSRRLDIFTAAVENFFQNGFFVFKIVVKRRLGHLASLRHLRHAGFFHALHREEAAGMGQKSGSLISVFFGVK